MKENDGEQVCPFCGFDRDTEQNAPFLPLGTVLQDGKYTIGKKLRNNAEGAEYIGYSKTMGTSVIISEFMPVGICGRAKGKTNMVIRGGFENKYKTLNEQFLSYYRNIANVTRLRELTSIAPILDIFTENDVSFTVEEHYESIPFTEYIDRSNGPLDWNDARPLFMPLLAALSALHKAGIGHYGISPENLVVTSEGKLRLTGFAFEEMRKTGGTLQPELMDGCAAPEQYIENGRLDETTDIYGFTATLFYALTGRLPENGDERKPDGKLSIPTAVFKRLPPHVVTALSGGLQVKKNERIASFEELKNQLSSAPSVKAFRNEANMDAMRKEAAKKYTPKKKDGIPGGVWAALSILACLLILLVMGIYWMNSNPEAVQQWFSNNQAESSVEEEESYSDPNLISIPDLVGQNYDELAARQGAGSDYTIIKANEEIFSDRYAEGVIVSQSPEPGLKANKGVVIVVTVSKGLQNRELPAISGQSLESAVHALGAQGFIASGNYVPSDTVEAGKVIGYENYNAGDLAPYGSKIVITISTGPESST